jgi:hypothetical protein
VLWAAAIAEQAAGLPVVDQEPRFGEILDRLREFSDSLPKTSLAAREALVLTAATTRHRLVTTLREQGKINRALELAEENVETLEQNRTSTSQWRMEFARSLAVAGDLFRQQNIWQKASERFNVSAELTEKIVQDEPRQIDALRLHLHCLSELLSLAGEMKNGPEDAAKLSQKITAIQLQINRLRPSQ